MQNKYKRISLSIHYFYAKYQIFLTTLLNNKEKNKNIQKFLN